MATTRNGVDTIDQTQVRLLSGGTHAIQFVTTTGATKTAGNLLMFDDDGNAVDSGISAASLSASVAATPILDSSGSPILDSSSGNWIFPG